MTIRHWHLTLGRHIDDGAPTAGVSGAEAGPGTVADSAPPAAHVGAGRVVRRLGIVGLALVLISAMDSIRNLPTTATFGWSAIFFYAIAVLTYLVPVALCSAELATTVGGGVYRWVR